MDTPIMRGPAAYRRGEAEALALFGRTGVAQLASLDDAGRPLSRTLHVVPFEGALAFHSSLAGEKVSCVGRQAVLTTHELVAEIPSHFVDPELACPATTYYRSAMAKGVLRAVESLPRKAAVLEALMRRYQPEGGYAPIRAEDSRYTTRLAKLLVVELRPEQLSAKLKLGQNKPAAVAERILEGLWRRGQPGDLAAIEAIRRAHPKPLDPPSLRAPAGLRLDPAPGEIDAHAVAGLLEGAYWLAGLSAETIAAAHLGSRAWIVAREPRGRVVASARALSDGARRATILDVIVAPELRDQGVGQALVGALLDHPALREVSRVDLRTRDAQRFYERLGFVADTEPFMVMQLKTTARGRARAARPSPGSRGRR